MSSQDSNPFAPPLVEWQADEPKHPSRGRRLWKALGIYFLCTYASGILGANLPENVGAYLLLLPAIPWVFRFGTLAGEGMYLATLVAFCWFVYFLPPRSERAVHVIAGALGVCGGLYSNYLSWRIGG